MTEAQQLFQSQVLNWYFSEGRDFVWRRRTEPAFVLVSEMLLRKTRAESAEPIVTEVFERYPTWRALADADEEDVQELLRPLGLFRIRARALQRIASTLVEEFGGQVPASYDALIALPHAGRYVANATLLFAHGVPRPIVDVNVVRLFGRYFGTGKPVEVHKADALWELAAELTPEENAREFAWGMLDLGATVCTPRNPDCPRCPLASRCRAVATGDYEGWRERGHR